MNTLACIQLYMAVYSWNHFHPKCGFLYTENLDQMVFGWNGFGRYEGNPDLSSLYMYHWLYKKLGSDTPKYIFTRGGGRMPLIPVGATNPNRPWEIGLSILYVFLFEEQLLRNVYSCIIVLFKTVKLIMIKGNYFFKFQFNLYLYLFPLLWVTRFYRFLYHIEQLQMN